MPKLERKYWAHSDPGGLPPDVPGARWQPLRDHVRQVGALAEQFALAAGGTEEFGRRARAIGLLHDFGKYTDQFQRLLRGEVKKAPHSIYGSAAAYWRAKALDAAFTVAGHHAGMSDPTLLIERLREVKAESEALWERAAADCPELEGCFRPGDGLLGVLKGTGPFELDLNCRMLLSCLVDADRLDTGRHAQGLTGADGAAMALDARVRLERLLQFVEKRAAEMDDGAVRRARREVLEACLAGADTPSRLLSLTVPTGGGKTLAAMAFALRRAVLRPEIRRVIVVIPYLSIIEQNARVYREALGGGVLEHHSAVMGGEEGEEGYDHPNKRTAVENWDAPVVVTTTVRFFESLFSNHPRDLRRMHNIARSVVILDEVQTLPRQFVKPVLSMVKELAERWNVTFVFSTATQPALHRRQPDVTNDPRWEPGTMQELMPEPVRLFKALRRVETDWRPKPLDWAEVAVEVSEEEQALVIVNTRGQALGLAEELGRRGEESFHLSTNLCPGHRLERLAEVRERLKARRRCLVVSTQLVEAGVDLDFPVVWRALGPLDSIAQAAGRCDREGKLTEAAGRPGGRLVVFEPADGKLPPGVYKEAAGITGAMAAAGGLQWDVPETIRHYFDRLYQSAEALDPKGVEGLRRELKFRQVADAVKWIDAATSPVIVPFDDDARRLIDEIRFAGVSLGRFRRAQKYTVNLWPPDFQRGKAIGSVYELQPEVWACKDGLYDAQLGIRLEGGTGKELTL